MVVARWPQHASRQSLACAPHKSSACRGAQGQNLGALLELSILQDTSGRYGLDDVMRSLYKDYYLRGKGFSTEDILSIINRLTRSDYTKFFRKYVAGVDVPPYNDILGYAGFQLDAEALKEKRYKIVEVACHV